MTDNLTILRDLKGHIQKGYKDSVKEIILFGSRLNGKSYEYSDYDILIVLENDYNTLDENKIYDLCFDMDLKYNIIIDAHLISTRGLNTIRGKQPLFANAIKSGLYA